MITCLQNFIGIRDIPGYDTPTSGDYINDLPGITTTQYDQIAEDEEYALTETWENIEKRSINGIQSDINIALKKYFRNYSFVNNTITGFYDDSVAIAQSDNLSGWYFDMSPYSSNLMVNLNFAELYLSSEVTFDLYVYNVATGDLLDTITTVGVEGINRINILGNYPVWKYSRLYVCYDNSIVSTIKASDQTLSGFPYVKRGEIPTASQVAFRNFTGSTSGLILNFNIDCSIDQFVCNRVDLFRESFLYKLGIEFCNERIYSDRVNRYTLLDREEAIRLRDEFKIEYIQKINGVLQGLQMNSNDFCFECNKAVNMRYMIP